MAVSLPNGVILSLATGYANSKTITAITNANPAVASSAAHGLANGALVELKSGWQKLNERIVRVADATAGTFTLEGMNTLSPIQFPAGTGGGSIREITAFTQITQVLETSTSGGEMQFATFSFMENDFESQIPTQASAQSLAITIADDPTLPGYKALQAAAELREVRALRVAFPNGSVLLYNGYVSFNETPTMNKGEVMGVQATFSLLSRPVRYAA
ncbi:phage tail protein [Achromobacter ruhlandii]|uniref:phage tail protein n=1 Tax=Achromobacter ruhlandii TaxID=72557 RepID=UPI00083B8E3A|nr:phage tail protein [Achromobacter ruhlandii]OCZ64298.1 phage tail protein [Achromobacter xylosoxidans]MCV6795772.1 phage tail protein [Achromobacter ruhlandii]MCV6800822.1 phage tail protein [Achromobacter ruhlandii]MCV6807744.1 phage tail protein [Achromobacter ruhlandii]MCV6818085.1 phage tail protein [Achromobacter ruhlandii]